MITPGARIVVRDAEWLVHRVDPTSTGGFSIHCVGLSEIVKDKESIFLSEAESLIQILDPRQTTFRLDLSSQYHASTLYLESLLRQSPPTDENLYLGHRAAMDILPYQLEPALQALQQPRQRILIADAVGLGKTLEAGILLAELIKRGRGKRIMVVTIRSMLTQFQKEMWNRFAIPLTRLDSTGLQRVRTRIPTNHNPFYYFDKSIISIDTLKQDNEYRNYLEQAYWDIIVIDEAHHVADRGHSAMRNKLARRLSRRSDTLIMLSATPHDGRPESFASLMNMLDPTAIANPQGYTAQDIRGLYIRRFKKDILSQVTKSFQEREILQGRTPASQPEERAYDALMALSFQTLDRPPIRGNRDMLFRTVLQKSLFSSPAACVATIRNRIKKVEQDIQDRKSRPASEQTSEHDTRIAALAYDLSQLNQLADVVAAISVQDFSKYQRLLQLLQSHKSKPSLGWNPKDPQDRLVIFTERRETLSFLKQHLARDLKLKTHDNDQDISKDQILELHGGMSDIEQQQVVEAFGQEKMPVRILVASDVASEGINLHYLSHRMIHFDIPWSLMVFQQRNGRIDRYGQEKIPQIVYLMTESQNQTIQGDLRILDILTKKDQQAYDNIGDPSAFMKVYDIQAEERITAAAIESHQSADAFDAELDPHRLPPSSEPSHPSLSTTPDLFGWNNDSPQNIDPFGWMDESFGVPTVQEPAVDPRQCCRSMPSLFPSDYAYLKQGLHFLRQQDLPLQVFFDDAEQRISLTATPELKQRFRYLPREIWPDNDRFILSAQIHTIYQEIQNSRKSEHAWPQIHYLWELHPVMQWLNDHIHTFFGRQEAPVLFLPHGLQPHETVVLMNGIIPNRKSHPLIFRWFGVRFLHQQFQNIESLESLLQRIQLHQREIPNPGTHVDLSFLLSLRDRAVKEATTWMEREQRAFQKQIEPKLQEKIAMFEHRQQTHLAFLEQQNNHVRHPSSAIYEEQRRRVDRDLQEFKQWIVDTLNTEAHPTLQIVAAFVAAV